MRVSLCDEVSIGDPKRALNTAVLSSLCAFAIPIWVGAYWPVYSVAPAAASLLFRPLVLVGSACLVLLWFHARVTCAELQIACLLGLLAGGTLIPSIAATDPLRSLMVWAKLIVLCAICLALCRGLRQEHTAKFFGAGLIVSSFVVAAFILLTYVRFIGFVVPGYKLTREFKGIAERTGIPLNAVPFTCLFSFLAGMSILKSSWLLWLLGGGVFVISSAFTGSRSPVALLLLTGTSLLLLRAFQNHRLGVRLLAYTATLIIAAGTMTLILQMPFSRMSAITEGRWDLWYVAIKKFAEQPVIGPGYDAWHDDLVSLLPGAYRLTSYMARNIVGGYHNEYLALLAEQGLIGFVPAMALVTLLFCLSWKTAFRHWSSTCNGNWILFTCIFLLLRAGLEIPGLFGDGSEPADFLAYMFIAIVVSRFSREEDFLRVNTSLHDGTTSPGHSRWAPRPDVSLGLDRSYV